MLGYVHTLNNHVLSSNMQRFSEAERPFRRAVDEKEMILGGEHTDTITSKYTQGLTFQHLQRYSEARGSLRQAVDGQESTRQGACGYAQKQVLARSNSLLSTDL
jgi:hypothetical protein